MLRMLRFFRYLPHEVHGWLLVQRSHGDRRSTQPLVDDSVVPWSTAGREREIKEQIFLLIGGRYWREIRP